MRYRLRTLLILLAVLPPLLAGVWWVYLKRQRMPDVIHETIIRPQPDGSTIITTYRDGTVKREYRLPPPGPLHQP